MKKLFLIFVLVLLPIIAKCDTLKVPMSCYPKKLQVAFAEYGMKLDLSGNDRTKDSWGWIENKGAEFIIYTYHWVSEEEFNIITAIFRDPKNEVTLE